MDNDKKGGDPKGPKPVVTATTEKTLEDGTSVEENKQRHVFSEDTGLENKGSAVGEAPLQPATQNMPPKEGGPPKVKALERQEAEEDAKARVSPGGRPGAH